MPRSFNLHAVAGGLKGRNWKDPRMLMRLALGVLLLCNLLAAFFAFRPLGGTPEELEAQAVSLRTQIASKLAAMNRQKALVDKMDKAKNSGDTFLSEYFMTRRNASSSIVSELQQSAKAAGIKPKEHAFAFEPVEGSETLSMMTINGSYEGSYADLMQYLNKLDRSKRFVIVESLAAAPQQQGQGLLNVNMKMNTFVRDEGIRVSGAAVAAPAEVAQRQ